MKMFVILDSKSNFINIDNINSFKNNSNNISNNINENIISNTKYLNNIQISNHFNKRKFLLEFANIFDTKVLSKKILQQFQLNFNDIIKDFLDPKVK